jgi:hypothetical protein
VKNLFDIDDVPPAMPPSRNQELDFFNAPISQTNSFNNNPFPPQQQTTPFQSQPISNDSFDPRGSASNNVPSGEWASFTGAESNQTNGNEEVDFHYVNIF